MPETASRTNLYIDRWMDISNGELFQSWNFLLLSFFFFFFVLFLPRTLSLFEKKKKYRFHLNFDLRSQENQLIYKFSRVSPFVHRYFRSRDQDQYLQLISSLKFFYFYFFSSFFKERQVELTLDMLIFFLIHISD